MNILDLIRQYYKIIEKKSFLTLISGLLLSESPVLLIVFYPVILKNFINAIIETHVFPVNDLFLFFGLFISMVLFSFTGSLLHSIGSLNSSLSLRRKIFNSFMHIPKNKIKAKGEPFFSRIINEDISVSMNIFNEAIISNFYNIVRIFPVLYLVFRIDPVIDLLFIVSLIFSFTGYNISQKILPRKYKTVFNSLGDILSFISESLFASNLCKRYGYLDKRNDEYKKMSQDLNRKYYSIARISSAIKSFVTALPLYTIRGLLIGYIGCQLMKHELNYGDVVEILACYSFIESPSNYISFLANHISQIKGNIIRILEYLEEAKGYSRKYENSGFSTLSGIKKDYFVTIENVNITANDKKIIENLNMTIDLNEKKAIVGLSGIGKSSLINILSGETDNYTGEIFYFNGNNSLKKYDFSTVINHYYQDPIILNISLQDNIVMGNPFDEEYYNTILKELELLEFRKDNFGYNGAFLSGGEKQKIAFARFLYNFINKDFFIIDEPFVSLDHIYKNHYLKILKKYIANKTGIVISHDFNVILEITNSIFFIENNLTHLNGTHYEILNRSTLYQTLFTQYRAGLENG